MKILRTLFGMMPPESAVEWTPQMRISHPEYGRIYPPFYNPYVAIDGRNVPELYDREGRRMEVFFIRDRHMAHDPYGSGPPPTRFLWDRFNVGLKTHFYSHDAMLETMGHPDRRFALFVESESIVPFDYQIFDRFPGLEKDFDAVFTASERMLDRIPNARFFPLTASPWYGTAAGGGILDERACERKTKMVSICSSDKEMCDLHRYRLEVARRCRREGLADAFGTFDGGQTVKIAETLTEYRYSIVIENSLSRYFFTERLTNCFLAMTVPVYCGTPAIGEFFNTDGMIILRPGDDIRQVLAQCSDRDYLERISPLRDNFSRAMEYRNMWNWLYDRYLAK